MVTRLLRPLIGSAALLCAISCGTGVSCASPPVQVPDLDPSVLPLPSEIALVGAGDIATCGNDDDERTARIVEQVMASSVNVWAFTAGDNAYPNGSPDEFQRCYMPTWGRFLARTIPVPGNHDYRTAGAAGYFATFGEAAGPPDRGYRSSDIGPWHIVQLNSNCGGVGGCGPSSPQAAWLEADLAASDARCTLAIFHHPLFSSGAHGSDPRMRDLWRILARHGADVVVAGHDHTYERFDALTADGVASSADGMISFVVGTGGARPYEFGAVAPASVARFSGTPGVLLLLLGVADVRWRFLAVDGRVLDEGRADCR